jgi:hypothetical protein
VAIETNDVKLPEHFFNLVLDWRKPLKTKSIQILSSLAINDYNEKLRQLTDTQMKNMRKENFELIKTWKSKHLIDGHARGLPKIEVKY